MNGARSNIVVRRVVAVLALLTTPFVAVERAKAQVPPSNSCTPAAPVNGTAVTCTGTVTNQNPPNGWGTGVETGDTITVQNGAVLMGTNGLFVGTANTVTNDGGHDSSQQYRHQGGR
jgi:hypothetical protein